MEKYLWESVQADLCVSFGRNVRYCTDRSSRRTKGDYVPSSDMSQNKPQISAPTANSKPAGPAALPTPSSTPINPQPPHPSTVSSPNSGPLRFKFGPSMSHLLHPPVESLPVGSDAWAFAMGYSSVVPLRAEFAGMVDGPTWFEDGSGRKIEAGQELRL